MNLEAFKFNITDGVGHITLDQAERGNPVDTVFSEEFKELSIECDENKSVRAVLIDAKGPYFSVGGDIKAMKEDRESLPRIVKSITANVHMAVSRFARMDAPVVVAVHSLVAGGVVGIVAAADFVLASPKATFYSAYCSIGFSCDGGTSYYLPRRVGSRKATEFLMLDQMWAADKACALGLINKVSEEESLATDALILAKALAQAPTLAIGELKRLLLSTYEQPLEAQLEHEARALARCASTDDAWSGINATPNKQQIEFSGQ